MPPNYNSTSETPHDPGVPIHPIVSQGGVMGFPSDRSRYAALAAQPTLLLVVREPLRLKHHSLRAE
jgi:hypothetical protein